MHTTVSPIICTLLISSLLHHEPPVSVLRGAFAHPPPLHLVL